MSKYTEVTYKNKKYISLARLIKELTANVDETREKDGDVVFGLVKFRHNGPRNYYIINDEIYTNTLNICKACNCSVKDLTTLLEKARHYVFKHSKIYYLGYFKKPMKVKVK